MSSKAGIVLCARARVSVCLCVCVCVCVCVYVYYIYVCVTIYSFTFAFNAFYFSWPSVLFFLAFFPLFECCFYLASLMLLFPSTSFLLLVTIVSFFLFPPLLLGFHFSN